MRVEVKPIDKDKWHGKKGKESFAQPKAVEVLYDFAAGKYASGLTEEEEIEYGKKLGVNLTSVWNLNIDHPYYGTAASTIKLPNHTVLFDDSKPSDFVKVKALKASKFVANSFAEIETSPEAHHYIFSESEEAVEQSTTLEKNRVAFEYLNKMNLDDKASIVQIISGKTVRGLQPIFIDGAIATILKDNIDEFIRIAGTSKAEVYTRSQVLEAIHRNILQEKTGGAIYYMDSLIGYDKEAATQWFLNPENQEQKLSILQKLTK